MSISSSSTSTTRQLTYKPSDSHNSNYEKVSEGLSNLEKYWICVKTVFIKPPWLYWFSLYRIHSFESTWKNLLETEKQSAIYDSALDIFENSGHQMLKIKVCVISQDSETLWDDAIMQQKSAI